MTGNSLQRSQWKRGVRKGFGHSVPCGGEGSAYWELLGGLAGVSLLPLLGGGVPDACGSFHSGAEEPPDAGVITIWEGLPRRRVARMISATTMIRINKISQPTVKPLPPTSS